MGVVFCRVKVLITLGGALRSYICGATSDSPSGGMAGALAGLHAVA